MIVSGPKSTECKLITSVSHIGKDLSSLIAFPGMPQLNELPPQHTGWQTFLLTAEVGNPASVTFVITDVGDDRYTTVVTLDDLQIESKKN